MKLGRALRRGLLLAAACHAGSAAAFFDVEVTAGKRWYEMNSGADEAHFGAQEFDANAHFNPFLQVPVAAGLGGAVIKPDKDEFGASEVRGIQVGLDVKAWLPVVPVILPYLRLNVPLYSSWVAEFKDATTGSPSKASYKTTGYRWAFGARYSLLPVLDFLLEAGSGTEKIEATEVQIDGKPDESLKGGKVALKSNAVLFGVLMGL